MDFLKGWIFMTLILFLILAPVSPVRVQAQPEDTPEPTLEATVVVEQPVVVPDTPTPPVPEGSIVLPAWQLVLFIGGAFLGGGTLSIAAVGAVATKILNNPAALKNAEAVGNSVPQETAKGLIDLANAGIAVATLAKEALDRVPAETKVQQRE